MIHSARPESGIAAALAAPAATLRHHEAGLSAGTIILTAEGALPIEYLEPGDRIITRAGMRVLRAIDTPAPRRFALDLGAPETIYADEIMVRSDSGLPVAA